MIINKALKDDLPEILALQKSAYLAQAKIYNNHSIPPLTRTLDDLKNDFPNHVILKAVINKKIIGSVRAREKDGTCCIGRLMVLPVFQNKGIGKKLMNEIEKAFKDVKQYELFTGYKSKKNIYLYKKLGYKIFKTEISSNKIKLIYFKKSNI